MLLKCSHAIFDSLGDGHPDAIVLSIASKNFVQAPKGNATWQDHHRPEKEKATFRAAQPYISEPK
jgi:hypothetical protein